MMHSGDENAKVEMGKRFEFVKMALMSELGSTTIIGRVTA